MLHLFPGDELVCCYEKWPGSGNGQTLFIIMIINDALYNQVSQVSMQLQSLFVQMTDDSRDERPSLKYIEEQCCMNIQSKSNAKEEIYKLVACVLGTSIEEVSQTSKNYRSYIFFEQSSSDFENDENVDESNLEAEVNDTLHHKI